MLEYDGDPWRLLVAIGLGLYLPNLAHILVDRVDSAWRAWLLSLEPPWTPAHPVAAHLGIRMRPAEGGVLVDGFLRGSVAERAAAGKRGVARIGPSPPDWTLLGRDGLRPRLPRCRNMRLHLH